MHAMSLDSFLRSIDLDRYLTALHEEDVTDVPTLAACTDTELKEMGLKIGARAKIRTALQAMEASPFTTPTSFTTPDRAPEASEARNASISVQLFSPGPVIDLTSTTTSAPSPSARQTSLSREGVEN